MALDTASVMLLCGAKSAGVDFESTVMIGRQMFCPLPDALRRVFSTLDIKRDATAFIQQHPYGDYCEEFFSLLGASQVDSLDVSPYEDATILQDLELPLPVALRERFTVVHDGGSLEHMFNIPQALKNCMEMVRVGGHFTQVSVVNNFAGHGFWQLSPELIFRVFSPQNGFQLETVLIHEVSVGGPWYVVSDPEDMHARVELTNGVSTYLLTIAKRVANVRVFEQPPQQNHYVSLWETGPLAWPNGQPVTWRHRVPASVKRAVRAVIGNRNHFMPEGAYRRITEDEVLRGEFSGHVQTGTKWTRERAPA